MSGPRADWMLRRQAVLGGDRPAVADTTEAVGFAELTARIDRSAAGLAAHGIVAGDRVALLGQNSVSLLAAILGTSAAGAVAVPLNGRLSAAEMEGILADCSARLLVHDQGSAERAAALRGAGATVPVAALLESGGEAGAASPGVEPPPAALMYTAAVDGRPRGAMISHEAFVSQSFNQAAGIGLRAEDRFLVLTPIVHAAALSYLLSVLAVGGSAVLHPRFDPTAAVAAVAAEEITVVFGFAPMFSQILEQAAGHDLDSLRLLLGRDEPAVMEALLERWPGLRWHTGNYGQTETFGMAVSGSDLDRAALAAVAPGSPGGRPLPLTTAYVVDAAGHPAPAGAEGEIVALGPNVTSGYWGLSEVNARLWRDGAWHTGDRGRLDERGRLHFLGRLPEKAMIKTGGENVYPAEVEAVLRGHPEVAEVAVIGVPDPKWAESVKAVVVLRDDGEGVGEEDLMAFCRERIASYKKPRLVQFVADLPRDAAGAIARDEVERRFT